MAEEIGFEPTVRFHTLRFQRSTLNHSDTPPWQILYAPCFYIHQYLYPASKNHMILVLFMCLNSTYKIMKTFKKDLMDAINLLANIESRLQINFLNPNEKAVFYSIVMKENQDQKCIISDVIKMSKLSRSTVFKTLKLLQSKNLISLHQSAIDKREFNIQVEV